MSTEDYLQPDHRDHPETQTGVTNPAPTPRTDAKKYTVHLNSSDGRCEPVEVVDAKDMAEVERELAAKDAEIAELSAPTPRTDEKQLVEVLQDALACIRNLASQVRTLPSEKREIEDVVDRLCCLKGELSSALAAKDAEIQTWREARDYHMKDADQLRAEVEKLKAELGPLREIVGVRCDAESDPSDITNWVKLVDRADEATKLRAEVERLKLQNASLIEQRDHLVQTRTPDDEVQELRAELAAKDAEIKLHRSDKKKLHEECTNLTTEITEQANGFAVTIANLREEVARLTEQLAVKNVSPDATS